MERKKFQSRGPITPDLSPRTLAGMPGGSFPALGAKTFWKRTQTTFSLAAGYTTKSLFDWTISSPVVIHSLTIDAGPMSWNLRCIVMAYVNGAEMEPFAGIGMGLPVGVPPSSALPVDWFIPAPAQIKITGYCNVFMQADDPIYYVDFMMRGWFV